MPALCGHFFARKNALAYPATLGKSWRPAGGIAASSKKTDKKEARL